MKASAIALTFAILLHADTAVAAPVGASEADDRELETASGLDLSREWASYTGEKRSRPFAEHVDRRFRVRRNLGRGFVVAGATLVLATTFFSMFAFTNPANDRVHYGIAGASGALSVGLLVPGAVLWGVYARRLERLEAATDKRDWGLELAHRSGSLPIDNGGLGLRFAF